MSESHRQGQVIVAGYADWNVRSAAFALNQLGFDVTTLGAEKPNGSKAEASIGYHRIPLPATRKFANRFFEKRRHLFQNRHIWHLFERFDELVAQVIIDRRPRFTVLCSTMAEFSLIASESVGSKTILLQGSSPLQYFEEYLLEANDPSPRIEKRWKQKQQQEIMSATIVVVESTFVKRDCQKIGVPPERIHIIPPHVSMISGTTSRSQDPVTFGTIQVGFGKGTEKLIQWWSSHLQVGSSLYLLGKTDKYWKKKAWESQANIRWFGYLTGKAFDDVMRSISVAVFPTFTDGGPRSLFECMAYGHCPIVSERCAGADHIEHGVNGFVIPITDEDQWCRTIRWCEKNPAEVRRVGENARRYVSTHLGQATLSEKWNATLSALDD